MEVISSAHGRRKRSVPTGHCGLDVVFIDVDCGWAQVVSVFCEVVSHYWSILSRVILGRLWSIGRTRIIMAGCPLRCEVCV